MQALFSRPFPS